MKKISILVLLVLLLCGCSYFEFHNATYNENIRESNLLSDSTRDGDSEFYYYFDQKVIVNLKQNIILLGFYDSEGLEDFLLNLSTSTEFKIWNSQKGSQVIDKVSYNVIILESLSGEAIPEIQLEKMKADTRVKFVSYLMEKNGGLFSFSDEFSVRLKQNTSYSVLESLSEKFACKITQYKYSPEGVYYLQCSKDSRLSVLKLANLFYETGLFEFAAPAMFYFNSFASSDPFFSQQWGVNNTGQYGSSLVDINILDAWEETEGDSSITVVVMDTGVNGTHPDLNSNIVAGYDAVTGSGNGYPSTENDIHGTQVAGIIGAVKGNNIGISGVAPGCRIMPVKVGEYSAQRRYEIVYSQSVENAFGWARLNGADVINCSFGFSAYNSSVAVAIENATEQGRDGLGTVVVAASGNENTMVSFPASLYYVLSVGAISYDGMRVTPNSLGSSGWGSNYGSTLDVVAPGIMIPTTFSSNYHDYCNFNGTSAAAPHVSGIAALILSKYPTLPQSLVREAIERSAQVLPGYSISEDGKYPMQYRNDEIGYGLVNAATAIAYAESLLVQHNLDNTSGLEVVITNSSSYKLEDVIVDVWGTISGQTKCLVSYDIIGGIESGHVAGYPVYRGYPIDDLPNTPITNISLDLFASCIDCPGNIELGVAFDTPTPNSYQQFSFGSGDSFHAILPNIAVPNAERRTMYVRIFDVN